jgi:hypothetical protein
VEEDLVHMEKANLVQQEVLIVHTIEEGDSGYMEVEARPGRIALVSELPSIPFVGWEFDHTEFDLGHRVEQEGDYFVHKGVDLAVD